MIRVATGDLLGHLIYAKAWFSYIDNNWRLQEKGRY